MTIDLIFKLFLIPLSGILSAYLISFVKNKIKLLQEKTDNELTDKYLEMLNSTIEQCVIATNQTYVEALKREGSFDLDAQKKAFQMTIDAVTAIIDGDAVYYLNNILGDVEKYVEQKIESTINKNKGSL